MNNVDTLLSKLRSLNIQIWLEDADRLRYRAPEGTVTPELLQELKQYKAEIVTFLQELQTASSMVAEPVVITRQIDRQSGVLSSTQRRLWLFQQMEPESSAYHINLVLSLKGRLDLKILQQTLDTVLARHQVLRTRFIAKDGVPIQVIEPVRTVDCPHIDLREESPTQRESVLQATLQRIANKPFDLTSDLMLRASLIQLGDQEHVLQIILHHIAADGWSVGVFIREFSILYEAFLSGQPNPLPELPIQYADFAEWQQQWMAGTVMDKQLSYWKRQLSGAPPLLELPTDYPRPPKPSYQGSTCLFTLSRACVNALKQLSQQTGSTLFMTLLAAFNILLYRYTRQETIVVGTAVANRNQVELEGLIGYFSNTLALRTDLSGDLSFRQLLERVREVALNAYAHQDMPFEKLVEELQPERSLSYSPLFQVMLILHNDPESSFEFSALDLQAEVINFETSPIDLAISVGETADGLEGCFVYSTDLFQAATVERMVGHFQSLLESIVANPDQKVGVFPLLTAAECQQLLVEWNNTQRKDPQDESIHQLFEAQVEQNPDAVAVVFGDQQLSYRELNNRANQLAHYLRSQGVGPDVLVGLCVDRSLAMMIGLLGILKAGGAYVPLDPAYPKDRLAYMLEDAQPLVLLTQSRLKEQLSMTAASIVLLDEDWEAIAQYSQENLATVNQSHHLAYIIYTSGSTGKPKGVMIEHRSLLNFVQGAISTYELTRQDSVLQFASISFDAAAEEIYPCLLSGGKLVLRNQEMLSSGKAFLDACNRWGITVLDLPTAYWHQLVDELVQGPLRLLPSLRLIIIGGEEVRLSQVKRWQHHFGSVPKIINSYGPTETTVVATAHTITNEDTATETLIPIGQALPNVQVYVLDDYQQPVPVGVPGELYIGGTGVARGYLHRADLSSERFIPNPFGLGAGDRLYRSGDLVRYRSNGALEFLGRVDNQVKVRGFRIELGEIETALSEHAAVSQAMVMVREDDPGDKRLVAYVITNSNKEIAVSELRQFLQQSLPSYMIPSAFVQLDAFPLTPNGKVDTKALSKPEATDIASGSAYVAPRTPTEEVLAEIWADVLKLERVGIYDNFFELGGHSLLAVQLFSKLEQRLDARLPLVTLFQSPTIAQLGETLCQPQSETQQWSSLVAVKPEGSKPPLFFHGGAADALTWSGFVRRFGSDQPIYVLQRPDLNGFALAENTVEALAKQCITEIRSVQPSGPYRLAGHCFGGMIVFEMAQQLKAQGEVVDLLALIDAYAPPSIVSEPKLPASIASFYGGLNYLIFWLQKTSYYYFADLSWKGLKKQWGSLFSKQWQKLMFNRQKRQAYQHYQQQRQSPEKPVSGTTSQDAPKQSLPYEVRFALSETASYEAQIQYMPKPYADPVVLIQPNKLIDTWYYGPAMGWKPVIAGELDTITVEGFSSNLFNRFSLPKLVEALESYLD